MIIAALVFCGCQCLVFICLAVAARHWYNLERQRLKNELTDFVRAFIEAPDEKTPSPLAALVDQGAMLLAARLMQQLKAMLAGVESGLSKGEQLELIEGAAQESPFIAMISNMLPKRIKNALLRNPQMVAALSKIRIGSNGSREAAVPLHRHRD